MLGCSGAKVGIAGGGESGNRRLITEGLWEEGRSIFPAASGTMK